MVEKLGHLLHDDEQYLFEFEGLGEGARDLVEDAQMVHLAAFDDLEGTLISHDRPQHINLRRM